MKKDSPAPGSSNNTDNHELFLNEFIEHKMKTWKKYIMAVPMGLFAVHWIYSMTDHFQSIPDVLKMILWGIMFLSFIIAGIISITSKKCPVCRCKMKKLEPAPDDTVTTYKYYCEQCRVWVDTGQIRNYD